MPSTSSTIPTLPCRQRTSQAAVLEPSARSQLRQPAPTAPSRELASGAVLFRSSAKSTSDLFHQKHSSGRLRPSRFLSPFAQDTLARNWLIFSQHLRDRQGDLRNRKHLVRSPGFKLRI